jgi:hypothetical protein
VRSMVLSLSLLLGPLALPAAAQQTQPAQTRDARIAELIQKLSDEKFDTREAAQRELVAIGAPALRALEEASRSPDADLAARATEAISQIRGGRGQAPAAPESREPRPQDLEAPPLPVPDMRDVFRELPPEFQQMQKMLEEMLRGQLPDQDEQPTPDGQPRVRVWQWSNGPRPQAQGIDRALGLELAPATPALRAQLGIEGAEGVVVNDLDPSSVAAQAGLQRYDVIVGVDGRSVRSARDLQVMLKKATRVELYRRAQQQALEVPALQAPAPTPPAPAPRGNGSSERSF